MNEQSKVVSIRQFKNRRRLNFLKSRLTTPTALMISALTLIFGIGSIVYSEDTKVNPTHGFKPAKADLTKFNPSRMAP